MDVDKAIAVVSAAGIELTDKRRNGSDEGWSLSFANGAELQVGDDGKMSVSGKGSTTVAGLLGLKASGTAKSKPRRKPAAKSSHRGG